MMTRKLAGAITIAALALAGTAGGAQAQSVSGQGTWETTLIARDLDGNFGNGAEAYYDTVLNVTWLRNANSGLGSVYDIEGAGTMSWADGNAFTAGLNIGGVTGWRQPTVAPINGDTWQYYDPNDWWTGNRDQGYNITSPNSEMAHMFHVTLGNLSFYDTNGVEQAGAGVTNMGNFQNLSNNEAYWFGVEFENIPNRAWIFYPLFGSQGFATQTRSNLVWAVHDGDVGSAMPVPEPESYALMLLGLGVVVAVARRRRA